MLHAQAMWREADFGAGYTSDDTGVQRLVLNQLAKWDRQTEELCLDGRP